MRLATAFMLLRCLTFALTGCTSEPESVSTTLAFATEPAETIGDDATADVAMAPAVEIRTTVGIVGAHPVPPRPAPRARVLPPKPAPSMVARFSTVTPATPVRAAALESYILGAYASEAQCEHWAETQCRESAQMGCERLHPRGDHRAASDRFLCSPRGDTGDWVADCYVRCVTPHETLAED